jgi:hypothetical protein
VLGLVFLGLGACRSGSGPTDAGFGQVGLGALCVSWHLTGESSCSSVCTSTSDCAAWPCSTVQTCRNYLPSRQRVDVQIVVSDGGYRAIDSSARIVEFVWKAKSSNWSEGLFVIGSDVHTYSCDSIGGSMTLDGVSVEDVEPEMRSFLTEWSRAKVGWPP